MAQKVLAGATKGYRHHPQLFRFRSQPDPLAAIASFLLGLADEAQSRHYRFDSSRISARRFTGGKIAETRGQLLYEWRHLNLKLRARAPHIFRQSRHIKLPRPHPLFRIIPGEVREWEKQ